MHEALTRLRATVGRPVSIVLLTTVGVAILGLIQGFLYASTVAVLLRIVGVCALLGAFLGTIFATDPRSGFTLTDRPRCLEPRFPPELAELPLWSAA